jgi:hypothetical protein
VSDELDRLVESWLPLPDVAERLRTDVGKDRQLIASRRGERRVLCVPEALIADGEPLPTLPGTLTVLADNGYTGDEALRWLFTPDDTLPGTPVDHLRAGHKTEVRRRAQALGF